MKFSLLIPDPVDTVKEFYVLADKIHEMFKNTKLLGEDYLVGMTRNLAYISFTLEATPPKEILPLQKLLQKKGIRTLRILGRKPTHPGKVLEDYLDTKEMDVDTFVWLAGISSQVLADFVAGKAVANTEEVINRVSSVIGCSMIILLKMLNSLHYWEICNSDTLLYPKPFIVPKCIRT